MDISERILGAALGTSFGLSAKMFYIIPNIDYMYEGDGYNPFDDRFKGYFNGKFREVVVEDTSPDNFKIAAASQILLTVPKAGLKKLNEKGELEIVTIKQGGFIVIETSWDKGCQYTVESLQDKPGYYLLVLKQGSIIGIREGGSRDSKDET